MEITRQADYAVRAILEMAMRSDGARVRSGDISLKYRIPGGVLTRLLARLADAGIVDAQRGVGGGVRLARPAAEVTLLEVVETIDGPILLTRCARRPGECPQDLECVVHPVWMRLRDELRITMSRINFEQLASDAHERACAAVPVQFHSLTASVKGDCR